MKTTINKNTTVEELNEMFDYFVWRLTKASDKGEREVIDFTLDRAEDYECWSCETITKEEAEFSGKKFKLVFDHSGYRKCYYNPVYLAADERAEYHFATTEKLLEFARVIFTIRLRELKAA